MPHPYFDLRYWRKMLLTNSKGKVDESDARDLLGVFTGSPIALVGIEYYRHLARAKRLKLGPSVPVDQFIFGRGEPPERHLTKVHGLPYRPKDLAWPTDEFGKPLTFLAQYSFVDSHDHIGPLPGDVLLIFIKDMYTHGCILFEFEWQKLGIDDLVMSTPPPALEFPTCYAVRNRSCDFTDESIATNAFKTLVDPTLYTVGHPRFHKKALRALSCYHGMKIGGVPFWNEPSEIPDGIQGAGKFLCAFNGVNVMDDYPYPFTNEPGKLSFYDSLNENNNLIFYDGLILNFYIDEKSTVRYFSQIS